MYRIIVREDYIDYDSKIFLQAGLYGLKLLSVHDVTLEVPLRLSALPDKPIKWFLLKGEIADS